VDWQQAAALLIVAAAFLWLLRRALASRGGAGLCGGCGGCRTEPSARPASPLIELDETPPRASNRSRLPTRRGT